MVSVRVLSPALACSGSTLPAVSWDLICLYPAPGVGGPSSPRGKLETPLSPFHMMSFPWERNFSWSLPQAATLCSGHAAFQQTVRWHGGTDGFLPTGSKTGSCPWSLQPCWDGGKSPGRAARSGAGRV